MNWVINKRLHMVVGNANYSLLFAELLERQVGDEWFCVTQAELMKSTGLAQKTVFRGVDRLVSLGLVEAKRVGFPSKFFYRIDKTRLNG